MRHVNIWKKQEETIIRRTISNLLQVHETIRFETNTKNSLNTPWCLCFNFLLFQRFEKEAEKFQAEKSDAIEKKDDIRLRALNDRMVNVEKCFITAAGLPNQPITRHVIFAPSVSNSYGSTSFPGISDLVVKEDKTDQDWLDIREQASIVFNAISEASQTLKSDEN